MKSAVEPAAPPTLPHSGEASAARWCAWLAERFGAAFSIWNGNTGELVLAAEDAPTGDTDYFGPLVQAAAKQRTPQFLGDDPPVYMLALPLPVEQHETPWVATAAFVAAETNRGQTLADCARQQGLSENALADWMASQTPWPVMALTRCANAVLAEAQAEAKGRRLNHELERVSENLATTYEEISLLNGLTQNLRLSSSDVELGEITLEWLSECVRAGGVAIQYLPVAKPGECTYKCRTEPVLLTYGDAPLTTREFTRLIEHCDLPPGSGPFVANEIVTGGNDWPFPSLRQLIVVPLCEGDNVFGWLAAFNRVANDEFGTVEASFMASVAAILGIHSGNVELYRRQQEFLAGVVRALTSAIDAKDQYTCGHSDRVARVAVRLAREMNVESDVLNTVYMAGLLHDIGKIGINDEVLRKPGKLTDAEFDHIKQHPEFGYKILADLRELKDVLPVVLHHHEQWNGKGYPHQLTAENIPLLARIAAVADSYDAMTSDRPYRKGMPVETVDRIFREGSGRQWDPAVIEAYFRCHDDIRGITQQIRANLTLDVEQWMPLASAAATSA